MLGQHQGMSLSTTDFNDFAGEELDLSGHWLIDSSVRITRHALQIFDSELATSCFTPSIDRPILSERHRVAVSTRQLDDELILELLDLLRLWHEWTVVHIQGQLLNVAKAELLTGATTKTEYFTLVGEYHGVNITTTRVHQNQMLQSVNTTRRWLERIPILVTREG